MQYMPQSGLHGSPELVLSLWDPSLLQTPLEGPTNPQKLPACASLCRRSGIGDNVDELNTARSPRKNDVAAVEGSYQRC